MRNRGFYTDEELQALGVQCGSNVLISRKAAIYCCQLEIGEHVRIDDFCVLVGKIKIGSFVHIAAFGQLSGSSGITIEDFSNVSSRVSLFSQSDDYSGEFMTNPMISDEFTNVTKGKIIIKKHSIIGSGSIILPNITLAEGTAVGALSLINSNTQPWSIYAGIPAKKIKSRKQNPINLEKKFLNGIRS